MTKSTKFSTFKAAAAYAKSCTGKVKRNLNGDGWVVHVSSQQKTQKPPHTKLDSNKNVHSVKQPEPAEGWKISAKGNYYKKTSIGIFWVVKNKRGEWYLNASNTDMNSGYAFATPAMAMQKGNQIINSGGVKGAILPSLKIPVERSVPKIAKKVLPEPISPAPRKEDKIIPKKMDDWDGFGGARDEVIKMKMRGGS